MARREVLFFGLLDREQEGCAVESQTGKITWQSH